MASAVLSAGSAVRAFSGMRPVNCLDRQSQANSFAQVQRSVASKARTNCISPQIVVCASTASLLALGRFAFLPFHRAQLAKAGLPVQNGVTHAEAGDSRAVEVESFLKTNDPAGFTLVDVLGWGALGHAVAFFILATASNGYEPQF